MTKVILSKTLLFVVDAEPNLKHICGLRGERKLRKGNIDQDMLVFTKEIIDSYYDLICTCINLLILFCGCSSSSTSFIHNNHQNR